MRIDLIGNTYRKAKAARPATPAKPGAAKWPPAALLELAGAAEDDPLPPLPPDEVAVLVPVDVETEVSVEVAD